jgi:plastocyanin
MTMKMKTLVVGSLLSLGLVMAGCGDETESPTSAASSAASSGAGGEGTGGAGTGGDGTGGAGTGGAGTGGDGTGGAGGAGANLINGCDQAMAKDETGKAAVTIGKVTGSSMYDPKCVIVSAGTDVTWMMNLNMHPLVGGEVVGGTPTPDANSPIKEASSGMSVTYKLTAAGTYGFYCANHAPGMAGAVFVK